MKKLLWLVLVGVGMCNAALDKRGALQKTADAPAKCLIK